MAETIDQTNDTNNNEENQIFIKWTHEHENILIDWGDKAMCYRWLHSKSYEKYNSLNTWFTIPVIVMSTLTGTANFAQERVPVEYRGYFSMIVGGVNIAAGIITTIQNFLKISQLNESHRVASLSWDKFYRKIRVELAKSPDERQTVNIYLKLCNEEFDRLMETSPSIDAKIVKIFKKTFDSSPRFDLSGNQIITEQQKIFKEIKKPEICDDIESVRKSVYVKTENTKIVSSEFTSGMADVIKRKRNLDLKEKKINEFNNTFFERYNRQPTDEELLENLENEQENINKTVIGNWINRHKQTSLTKQNVKLGNNQPIFGDNNV